MVCCLIPTTPDGNSARERARSATQILGHPDTNVLHLARASLALKLLVDLLDYADSPPEVIWQFA